MPAIRSTSLRTIIALDAAACGVGGLALAFDAAFLAGPVGMAPEALKPIGVFLVAYAAVLAWLASRPALPRAVVWALVAFNLVWTVESVMLPLMGWARPDAIGLTILLVQAAGAFIVADLQFLALRRARHEAAA